MSAVSDTPDEYDRFPVLAIVLNKDKTKQYSKLVWIRRYPEFEPFEEAMRAWPLATYKALMGECDAELISVLATSGYGAGA